MELSNPDTSTPGSSPPSPKRGKLDNTNGDGPSLPDLVAHENFEEFSKHLWGPDLAKKLRLPCNEDIVHKVVAETRNAGVEEIRGRKKMLDVIFIVHRPLLHFKLDEERKTPLLQSNVHFELMTLLIHRGVPVHEVTQTFQFTFVHMAAAYLNPEEFHELVVLLLELGHANVLKARDCYGLTPIHHAVFNMEVKEETILLCRDSEDLRFDLKDVDKAGINVLTYAAMGGRDENYLDLLETLGA